MPWQEQSIMDLRREFVVLASQEGVNLSALCRQFEISRTTGYKWVRRATLAGETGLVDQSRRPHHTPTRTAPELERAILALRDTHPAWGARKIRAVLQRQDGVAPAPSTIHAVLRRHGRIDPIAGEHLAPGRFEAEAPNDLWQIDFKGDVPLRRGRCYPLSILDDHSRFALSLSACPDQRGDTVRVQLRQVFRRYGLPWRLLWDNGPPFGSAGHGPFSHLDVWLMRLGIQISHGRPYHPQTQGKVERFHRTIQAELITQSVYPELAGWQQAFEQWRDIYNLERPHQALEQAVPASRYRPSVRPFPEQVPALDYGPDAQVRRVDVSGKVSFQGRTIRVSKALRGERVGLFPTTPEGCYVLYFCRQHLGMIDLRGDASPQVPLVRGVSYVPEHL